MHKIYFKPTVKYPRRSKSAYSLLEMSLVILIISVLITGGIAITTSTINSSKNEITNKRLAVIYDAIGRFLAKNKRLPCPASLTKSKSESGYGQESDGDCMLTADAGVYSSVDKRNIVIGMVPINTLGLSDEFAEDGFGSKINYVVNSHLTLDDDRVQDLASDESSDEEDPLSFAATDVDQRRGFGLFSTSNVDLMSTFSVHQRGTGNKINDIAFVILSNGANKNGSFSANSSVQKRRVSSNSDSSNTIRNRSEGIGSAISSAKFGGVVSGDLAIVNSDHDSDSFDDIVMFKSRMDLVSDFNLARLMPCVPNNEMNSQGFDVVYAGELSTGEVCALYSGIRPVKKCGPMGGSWISQIECPSPGIDMASNEMIAGGD